MNDLQIALLTIGGLILLVLLIQLLWLNKKLPLTMNKEPIEEAIAACTEPIFGNEIIGSASIMTSNNKLAHIDSLIDAVAMIKKGIDVPAMSGDILLAAMPISQRVGSKTFIVEACNDVTSAWEFPVIGQRYAALQAAVQLANRTGALNEIEFSEFVTKVQDIADTLEMMPEFPEMMSEVIKARELDQFACAHDAQLSFTIRSKRALWSLAYLNQVTTSLGFLPTSIQGRFIFPNSQDGTIVLSLYFDANVDWQEDITKTAIDSIVLQLDVAHVERSCEPYQILRDKAASFATIMDGTVTDDGGFTISTEAMDKINTDLQKLYDELDHRDMAAGSAQAKRLFS
jgi:hypothetical protein